MCLRPLNITEDHMKLAIQRLDTGFAFIGILEEWSLSICLFHRMIRSGPCHEREFVNARRSKARQEGSLNNDFYDTSVLGGYVDHADNTIYQRAKVHFTDNLQKYGLNSKVCRET